MNKSEISRGETSKFSDKTIRMALKHVLTSLKKNTIPTTQ